MSERYDSSAITVLEGLQAIRMRPAMYVGSTGAEGLHNVVLEVVQNAVDEALVGACTRIEVVLHGDGSCSVEDDGRGIPVDVHPTAGIPACQVVMTMLHSGGKFEDGVYDAPGGLHGVGLAAVNALSSWLVLEVWRDGAHYRQRYDGGEAGPLERVGDSTRHGTRVHFLPDARIFRSDTNGRALPTQRIAEGALREHLQAQAFLQAGLHIRFAAGERVDDFQYDTGIVGYVEWLNRDRPAVHATPIEIVGEADGVGLHLALQWTHKYSEDIRGYVNRIFTPHGGTHLEGLKAALTHVINEAAVDRLPSHGAPGVNRMAEGESIAGYDVREGLTAVLSIRMRAPQFEGQTKSNLTSMRAEAAVQQVVTERLRAWVRAHPEDAAALVGRALEAGRARAASRRASERARYRRRDFEMSRDAYRQQFGIRSSNWHESARWITDRALLDQHAELTAVKPDALVLDACCGSGVVGDAFRRRVGRIVGLDVTPEMANLARTRLDEVVLGDVYEIPFEAAHFDMVVNREVLHLLPNPARPVAEIYRVLKAGGQFVVGQMLPYGAVDAPFMFRVLKKKQPLFFNNFLEEDFHALLSGAGFVDITMREVLQWEDIDLWIDTWETSSLHRHEIRDLYYNAPAEVRAAHPFRVSPSGAIEDCWRWCVFSAFKPLV